VDTTSVLRKLYVDDLVTDGAHRSRGVGTALLAELERRAAACGCRVIELDSGHQRTDAHRFYLREGFADVSRHFRREVP
jgi:GNAT superfamily N-acetyltransferase